MSTLFSKHRVSMLLALANGGLTAAFYVAVIHRYGIGSESDLFFATLLLPNVLFTVTFGQLTEILVPFFIGEEDRLKATAFWNVSFGVAVLASMLGVLALSPMIKFFILFFPSISLAASPLAARLLLMNSAYLIIFCVLTVKNCYLAACGHPIEMQLMMLPGGILSLAIVCVWGRVGHPEVIVLALFCGAMTSLFWPVRNSIWTYERGHARSGLTRVWLRVRWLLLNATILRCEPLFDGILSAMLGTGLLSVFYLFQRLIGFVHTAVQNGFILPVTKQLSECAEAATWHSLRVQLKRNAQKSGYITLILMLLAAGAAFPLRFVPIGSLHALSAVFEKHWLTFVLLIPYGVFVIVAKLYGTGLYVLRLEYLFSWISVSAFLVGIAIKIIAAKLFGLEGLAAGTSVWWFGYVLFLILACRSRIVLKIKSESTCSVETPTRQAALAGLG